MAHRADSINGLIREGKDVTKGIKIEWHYPGTKRISEIEHLYGINVENLAEVPAINAVPSYWPNECPDKDKVVEYNVEVDREWRGKRELRLSVHYDPLRNPELSEHPELNWGTNKIILHQGKREGQCKWLPDGDSTAFTIAWEAFDLEASHGRPRTKYYGSQREARFRRMILASDCRRCVLTSEDTPYALEAAHLIPAKVGENDEPSNGVALRADLHRLFDAGAFTFDEDGTVRIADTEGRRPSRAYRELLRGKKLPQPAFDRVRATLALRGFRERQLA